MMLRMIPARIPMNGCRAHNSHLWPPQRQRAVLYVLSRFVSFRLNRQRGQTLHDLMELPETIQIGVVAEQA